MAAGPWRRQVAVANLGSRPSDIDGVPVLRPLALLRDAGFTVHAIVRGPAPERYETDGVQVSVETDVPRVALRIARLRPELLFVESHTYGVALAPLARRSWVRNPLPAGSPRMRRLQRAVLTRFDAVSFTNPADRAQWRFAAPRHVDLAYPLDVAFWRTPVPRRESWWSDRGRPVPAGPVLVCNAAYARRKRVSELLEMLAAFLTEHRDAQLVFVGHPSVEADTTEHLHTRPAELGISDQVLVAGWMSAEDLRDLLAWTKVMVINSIWETQCLAVYEALAARVPTLIADIPVLTSQFPTLPAHTGEADLRANLERVLNEPDLADDLLASTRERVEWADVNRHDEVFAAALDRLLGRGASR